MPQELLPKAVAKQLYPSVFDNARLAAGSNSRDLARKEEGKSP